MEKNIFKIAPREASEKIPKKIPSSLPKEPLDTFSEGSFTTTKNNLTANEKLINLSVIHTNHKENQKDIHHILHHLSRENFQDENLQNIYSQIETVIRNLTEENSLEVLYQLQTIFLQLYQCENIRAIQNFYALFQEIFHRHLQEIASSNENSTPQNDINVKKIEMLFQSINSHDHENDFQSSIKYLNKDELNLFIDELSPMEVYKRLLSSEDLASIFTQEMKLNGTISLDLFWHHQADKNQTDALDPKANDKIIKALEQIFIFSDLPIQQRGYGSSEIVRDLLTSGSNKFDDAPEKIFQLISRLLTYAPLRDFVEFEIVNGWYEWCEVLKEHCEKVSFSHLSTEKVDEIINLLEMTAASYNSLVNFGSQPNENYAQFMLEFIDTCRNVNHYYIQLKAEESVLSITSKAPSEEDFTQDDTRKRMSATLLYNAFEFFNHDPSKSISSRLKETASASLSRNTQAESDRSHQEIAPNVLGHFNHSGELISITGKETSIEFNEFLGLNYGKTIPQSDFLSLMKLQNKSLKELIDRDFGVSLSDFDLRVQNQFLHFIKDMPDEKIKKIQTFFKEGETASDRKNRLISFLSLEQFGPEMGEKILTIGNRLPQEISSALFQKYASFVESVNSIKQLVPPSAIIDDTEKLITQIQDDLIKKANRLLIDFHNTIEDFDSLNQKTKEGASVGRKEEYQTVNKNKIEKLENDLIEVKTDVEVFKATFKTIKKNGGEVSLNEFNNLDWQSAIAPENIESRDRETMRTIYANNYPSPQYSQAFREELLQGFEERFRNPDCRFYLLKHKNGDIIGFNAYTDTETDAENRQHTYFGAFNINPAYGQSKLGEAMLDATLETEGKDHIIEAHCDSRTAISAKYIESGFVATACEDISEAPSFSIKRDLALNDQLITKRTIDTLTPDAIEALIQKGSPREYIRAIKLSVQEAFPKKYFDAGFVLTRYLFLEDGTRYAVFEKPSSKNTPATT